MNLLEEITEICELASDEFMKAGGSTRHWVVNHFLPKISQSKILIVDENNIELQYEDLVKKITKATRLADRSFYVVVGSTQDTTQNWIVNFFIPALKREKLFIIYKTTNC